MVTINHNEALMIGERKIDNVTHQHAFVLVGSGLKPDDNGFDNAFGVHMTQYHCELHKYQIILKFQFDFSEAKVHGMALDGLGAGDSGADDSGVDDSGAGDSGVPKDFYHRLRQLYPTETFFLCNANNIDDAGALLDYRKEFSIPELGSQQIKKFHGNIFFGIRPPTEKDEESEHFFPWSANRCRPVVQDVKVICERLVLYRPFDHVQTLPDYALYFLFGEGSEAFMTHLQTAQISRNNLVPKSYGPDYDDVVVLKHAPTVTKAGLEGVSIQVPVLGDALLEAGVVVSVPSLPLASDAQGHSGCYPLPKLFREQKPVTLMYRGIGPEFSVIPARVSLFVSAICNSPDEDPYPIEETIWTLMPERYWVEKSGVEND